MTSKVLYLLIAASLGHFLPNCVGETLVSERLMALDNSPARPSELVSPTHPLRPLPAEQYVKLRTQALATAKTRLGPKVKNPHVSDYGIDPAVLSVLLEQRSYLQVHRAAPILMTKNLGSENPENSSRPSKRPNTAARPNLFQMAKTATDQNAEVCNSPLIRRVNGRSAGAIFTPQFPDNHYVIEGCSFGSLAGKVQLEPDMNRLPLRVRVQPIALQLDSPASWSENEIDVHLDTHLSGVPDSAISLVIYSADGRQLELSGCLFLAARGEPRLLTTVPASWIKLQASISSAHPIGQLEYVSPPTRGDGVPHEAAGTSALVVRSDPEQFSGGTDSFDFSRLKPGWTVESIQLQNYSVSCPGDITSARSVGNWKTIWADRGFTVTWASNTCTSYMPPVSSFALSSSEYAIKVWVIGPAGTQPQF